MLDEKANIFKVRYLYGKYGRRCGGHKRESECALPGEICQSALCYRHREMPGRCAGWKYPSPEGGCASWASPRLWTD